MVEFDVRTISVASELKELQFFGQQIFYDPMLSKGVAHCALHCCTIQMSQIDDSSGNPSWLKIQRMKSVVANIY